MVNSRAAADLGVGLTPGASTIHDATVALTGYNVALNERVGWGGRGISLIGAVMPGVSGPSLRVGGTVLREVGEAALHVYRRANGYESASRLARKAVEAQQAIGLHGVSVVARVPPGAPSVPISRLQEHFPSDPLHFTVVLPNPVTRADADLFNSFWGRYR